jgi:hypothetical protein
MTTEDMRKTIEDLLKVNQRLANGLLAAIDHLPQHAKKIVARAMDEEE